jgi:hypothetical protein
MSLTPRTLLRLLLVAAAGLMFWSRPATSYGQDTPPAPITYYNLYEDPYGRPWCGGDQCTSGLCCEIKRKFIQPTSVSGPEFEL